MKPFPRLKFCGFTREVDVESAIEAGASAIGLNFVPNSKRFVEPSIASSLSRVAAGRILRVGVFVNSTPEEVADVCSLCELDAIQLHGDERLEWLERSQRIERLRGLPILRALPYRGRDDDAAIEPWSRAANDPASPVVAILVDAYDPADPAARGGTGKMARWDLLYPRPPSFSSREPGGTRSPATAPLILAGGIDRHNVLEACSIARPDGIDLASGIESAPGIKDREAMFAVAQAVRSLFADCENPGP